LLCFVLISLFFFLEGAIRGSLLAKLMAIFALGGVQVRSKLYNEISLKFSFYRELNCTITRVYWVGSW
jgi:hypothetical protein